MEKGRQWIKGATTTATVRRVCIDLSLQARLESTQGLTLSNRAVPYSASSVDIVEEKLIRALNTIIGARRYSIL